MIQSDCFDTVALGKRKELLSEHINDEKKGAKENLLEAAEEHISSANLSLVTDPSTSNASAIIIIMRMVIMRICK